MTSVELCRLEKRYRPDLAAVADLSLRVESGEYLVLLGPSGCGKTTTLRMVAGLTRPSSGDIRFDSQLVNDQPPRQRNVAMLFQEQALLPHLNIQKNLALGLRLRSTPRKEIKQRVEDATEILGIQGLLTRYPDELSGGERQRVSLGCVLVRRPRVCLYDEPLSHLDAPLRHQLQCELRRMQIERPCTTIHVTHDQAEAVNLGDRLAVMRDGQILQCGEAEQI